MPLPSIEEIIENYYAQMFRYCYVRMKFDENAAADCTQEVFVVLLQKYGQLDLQKTLLPWLRQTADYVMMNYRRANPMMDSLDTLRDIPDPTTMAPQDTPALTDLNDDEIQLLKEYYTLGRSKQQLAAEQNLTVTQLYQKIRHIKKKIRQDE